MAKDVFPNAYRLNTMEALDQYFDKSEWKNFTYGFNGVPDYHGNNAVLFRLFRLSRFWGWLTLRSLSAKFHIFIQKRL